MADLVSKFGPGLKNFLPAVVFLIAAFLGFATGTSWGTFTILLPIGSIFLVLHAIEYLVDVMSNKAACVKPAETEGGKETV